MNSPIRVSPDQQVIASVDPSSHDPGTGGSDPIDITGFRSILYGIVIPEAGSVHQFNLNLVTPLGPTDTAEWQNNNDINRPVVRAFQAQGPLTSQVQLAWEITSGPVVFGYFVVGQA